MASSNNVIKTLTIRGVDETQPAVDGLNKTAAAYDKVSKAAASNATVTDSSAKGQLSLADSVAKAERRFNASLRAQQDFERVQRQMNAAVAQNPALQERVNKVLADARLHYDRLSVANDNYASRGRIALQAVQAEAQGLASRFGVLGSTVAAMGPGWLIFGASLGVVTIGLHQAATAALQLAERAGKLKDFAETTGFTVIELQALEKAGEHVGVSSESVTKALERFSVQMAEVRLRTGETYEKLLAIDPTLARQASTATSLAKAYELVSNAIKNTDLERANQLARAFFGKGGVEQTRLMRVVADAGGLKGVIAELHQADIITEKQAERWDTLGDTIASNMRLAKQNIASIFTEDVLVRMERFSTHFLNFTRSVKEFGINESLQKFIDFFSSTVGQAALAGALSGALVAGPVGFVAGAVGGAIGGKILQNDDAKNAEETARQLDILNDARDRAIQKLGHYKTLAASPDNPFAVQDAERAEEYGRILGRVETRIKALGTATVAAPPLPTAVEVGINKVADAQESLRTQTIASFNEMARWMSVIGSASTLAERYELATLKLNAAKAAGTINEEQYARAINEQKEKLELSLGVADMAAATETRLAQVREVAAKAGLTDEQTRLAVALAQREAKERELQAWARLNPQLAAAKDAASDFTQSLLTGLLEGKNGFDVLIAAAGQFGQALMSIGTKDIAKGLTGGVKGLLDGKGMGGFSVDPASLAIGGIGMLVSFWSSAEEKRKKAAEEQAKAWEDWQNAAQALEAFSAKMTGGSVSTISTQISEATNEASRLALLRSKAMGYSTLQQENADPVIRKLFEDLAKYGPRLKEEFQRSFQPTIDAWNSGFGEDSPLFQAIQNAKGVGEKLQEFLANAEFIFGKNSPQLNEARGAAQQRALSLLQGEADPLSAVDKRMQEIQGTARALEKVLQDLGLTSEEARRQIDDGVIRAIETLKKAFTEDLQRELNDLQGKGFLNEFFDLFKKNAERLKDNAALGGGNEDLIAKLFGLSAQGIVDRFKLTGESFQELIKRFPELSGVVKEFSELVTEASKRSAEEIAQGRLSIEDEIFRLTNDATTLEGQLAELRRRQDRERLEEEKAGNENRLLLLEKHHLEEARLIKEADARKLEEAKRAAEEQARAINQAARGVLETIQGWQAGPSSTLSPQDILTNAQAFYSSNLALAQGNPADQVTIDAVNKWPQLADNVEKALRSVYASGALYQTGKSQLISEGLALPTVQAADDPLLEMMRRVAEATEATVEELTNTIKTAIDAGNAAAVATALGNSTLFQNIDTNTNNSISFQEMKDAFGTSYNAGTLKNVFDALDGNGDGILDKAELIKQNIGTNASSGIRADIAALSTKVGLVAADTIAGIRPITIDGPNALQRTIEAVNAQIIEVKQETWKIVANIDFLQGTVNETRDAVGAVNRAIGLGEGSSTLQALNATAKDQLTLLNNNLTGGTVAFPGPGGGGTVVGRTVSQQLTDAPFGTNFSNNMILALNKIVYNTAATAHNTGANTGANSWVQWGSRVEGILAQGGWIGGLPHSQGGTIAELERGEHVTNRISAGYNRSLLDAINAARGPLDLTSLSGMNDNFRITPNIVPLPVSAGRSDAGFNFARMLSVMEAQSKETAELKEEVASFRKEHGKWSEAHMRSNREEAKMVVSAEHAAAREVAQESRFAERRKKAKAS